MSHLLGNTLGEEAVLLKSVHANTLLVGPPVKTDALVREWLPELPSPIVEWRPGDHEPIPSMMAGTVILHDVASVPPEQQASFEARLRALGHRLRVVSTSVAPVWPVVQRGDFLASLYYRLNVWYVNLTEPPGHSAGLQACTTWNDDSLQDGGAVTVHRGTAD